jgi:hypothetical protein
VFSDQIKVLDSILDDLNGDEVSPKNGKLPGSEIMSMESMEQFDLDSKVQEQAELEDEKKKGIET